MDGRFEVRVLGPIEVQVGEVPVELPQGRSRALVALLALEAGRTVSTGRLVDELWGTSPPATVVTALHGLVSELRRRIGSGPAREDAPGVLVTRPPGYLLDIAPDQVDAHRFRAQVHHARAAPSGERVELLRAALASWHGPALADTALLGPASGEAVALEELRLAAHEDLIDAELDLGHHRDLVAEIEVLVAEHPLRERLYGQLMLAHYRSGRQSEALGVWHRVRTLLVDQVGVEPGMGLRRLQQAILELDPALDVAVDSGTGGAGGANGRELDVRAGELLAAAGTRVFERHYDAVIAEELLTHAEQMLPPGHPQRADIAERIPETYQMLGRHADADARLTRSLAEARERGDTRREAYLRLERARIQLHLGPDPIPMGEIEAVANRAIEVATSAGDDEVVSQACFVLTLIEWRRGRIDAMEAVARRGLEAGERSGSMRERLAARWMVALALVEGATPPEDAITECQSLAAVGPAKHAGILTELARLHALRGEHDVAQGYITQAEGQLDRRAGMLRPAMFVSQRTAEVLLASGHPEVAEPHLRAALALADEFGEADQRAQLAAKLARVLLARGAVAEAEELALMSRHAAPSESVTAQVLWRTAMAGLRAAANDTAGAGQLVQEATALAPDGMRLLAAELRGLLPAIPTGWNGHLDLDS